MASDLPPVSRWMSLPLLLRLGSSGRFTPDEAPKSIGRAAQDLPRDMQMRDDYLKKLVETKGEPGYGTRLADSFTMGLTRPMSGALAAAGPGEGTAAERYRAAVGAEEDYAKRAERNTNPYLGAAADVVGGVASGGPALGLVKGGASKVAVEAPTMVDKLARLMVGSTGSGAIEGAARNAESPENAAVGAGVGGAVGGVTGKVVGAASKLLPGVRGAQKEVTEAVREGGAKALTEEGGKVYTKLDQAGIKYKDTDTPKLVTDVVNTMKAKGFNRNIHDELVPVVQDIGRLHGKPATWTELQNVRTQLSDAKASDDKRVRKMAGHLTEVLDNFTENTRPVLPPRSVGINVGEESKTARDLWRRGSQAANVEYLSEKGMIAGKDPARKLETNFGTEIDKVTKPGRYNPNSPEQMKLMEEIAKGDPNRAKLASGMNRWSNNLIGYGTAGAAGGAGLASVFGDQYGVGPGGGSLPGMAAIGVGLLGKRGASGLRKGIAERGGERVNDLIRNIVTGSTNRDVVNTPRDALAKILAAEQLKRGAGRYSSSLFNKE
jgi:hypothetical protein